MEYCISAQQIGGELWGGWPCAVKKGSRLEFCPCRLLYLEDVENLLFVQSQMLYVDSLLDFVSSLYGRFLELLPAAQLTYHSCLFKFTFEFLESLLNVFAFFDRYYNHSFTTSFC